ncbi:MAG: DUF4124 domain-containing protein [Candidatus Accumulibacter sp.]|uniref:DUF4124 domain-containing protein n=1 Tax=Accumulibacter sp. TaxID=2053492 RepID=UPI001ACB89C9|nr:DUF4124 domain-containing protein [Accumulibacter sp.]MBN8516643.1 DUF4124 domain-containing protein [Accumulibacter sp.]MBO3712883.1 DUF4124 domain-containing protein [Accumulibacter sp.]
MIARLAVLIGALAPTIIFAQTLYRCTEGGIVTYAERPCGKSAVPVSSLPPAPRAVPAPVPQAPSMMAPADGPLPAPSASAASAAREEQVQREAKLARMAKERRMRDLEYEIRDTERAHDDDLARLRDKKRYSANNLAGATWEESISQEMQAVTTRYNARIDTLRRELAALRSQ